MSHPESDDASQQEPSLTAQIDSICDQFEQQWKRGQQPQIREYLERLPQSGRSMLFRELIGVEIDYRMAAGHKPSPGDYKDEYPEYADILASQFSRQVSILPADFADESGIGPLFRRAVGLSVDERAAFLAGLPEQKRILVQRLLQDHDGEGTASDHTVVHSGDVDHSEWAPPEQPAAGTLKNNCTTDARRRFGPYTVEQSLASGAYGDVYRCHDERLSRDVAVKVPRLDAVTEEVVEQFQLEAKQLAQLDHSSIVKVHDFGFEEGLCYIVSEFVPGPDLNHWRRESRPHWIEICRVVEQIAEALAYAHSRKTVHRDIKPANVRLKEDGRPVVLDFGLAISSSLGNAAEGVIAGTPSYMSPEQVQAKGHRIDGRTDIYSLGVLLYQLLTGQLPFQGKNRTDLFRQIIQDDPQPPRQLVHDLPVELERICLKAMCRRPEDRYSTAADLARDIRALLKAEGVDTVQGSWRGNSHSATIVIRPRTSWKAAWPVSVAFAVVMLGIAAVIWARNTPGAGESATAGSDAEMQSGRRETIASAAPMPASTAIVRELLQRLEQARSSMGEAQTWQLQGNLQQARGQLDSVLDDLDYVLAHDAFASIPQTDQNDTRLRWVTGMIRYCATIDRSSPADAAAADENLQIAIAQIRDWLAGGNEALQTDLSAALGMAHAVRAELNCFAPGLDPQAALSIADAAIRELRDLPRTTTDAFFRRELANSLKVLGRVETSLHRYDQAVDDLQRALSIFESLVQLEESVGNVDLDYLIGRAETLALLAGLMDKLGRKADARKRFAEGIRDFHHLANVASHVAGLDTQRVSLQANFAAFLQSLGLSTLAKPELQEALSIIENMPADLRSQSRLQELSLRSLLAEIVLDCGDSELARRYAATAIDGLHENSDDPRYMRELALAHMVAGRVECATQNYEEAENQLSSAIAVCQTLRGQNASDDFFVDLLAWAYEHAGRIQLEAGRAEAAAASLRDAYSLRKKLAESGREVYVLEAARFLANCELPALRQPQEALQYLEDIQSEIIDADAYRRHHMMALYREGKWDEVISLTDLDAVESIADVSSEYLVLAMAFAQTDKAESAAEAYRTAHGYIQRNRPGSRDMLRLQQEARAFLPEISDAP